MKLWIDDVRPAPNGYLWCKSVNEAIYTIETVEKYTANFHNKEFQLFVERKYSASKDFAKNAAYTRIELIDIDHDAGDYASEGGDYIRILDWLEKTGRNYPIRIHSMNPVGVVNMRRIIERNGWTEVK